jgi:N-acetylglutamate synthase-like GNAT family acetyltransferase
MGDFLKDRFGDRTESPFVHYEAAWGLAELDAARSIEGELEEDRVASAAERKLLHAEARQAWLTDFNANSRILKRRMFKDGDAVFGDDIVRRISKDAVAVLGYGHEPVGYMAASEGTISKGMQPDFIPFERFEGNETLMPKGSKEGVDTATLLQEIHRPAMRDAIERDMGISLADLSLREQIQLLSYLASVDVGTAEKGFKTIAKDGIDGARAFLSCEYGKRMGDAVITISEKMDQASAHAIFRKYAEIVDLIDRDTAELEREFFVMERGKRIDRGRLDDEILGRAKGILEAFAKRLGKGEDVTAGEVIASLERFSKDSVQFASMFKEAAKGKTIDFRDIRGLSLESSRPADIDEPAREEMRKIVAENWSAQMPSAAPFVAKGFEKVLDPKNDATSFWILKKDGHVVAFMRFDTRPDLGPDVLYAGSLNIAPALRGSAIGEAMLKTVDAEAATHTVHADFFPEVAAGTMYVERFGFVATGVEEVKTGPKRATVQRFKIVRNDHMNAKYRARREDMTKADLIAIALKGNREGVAVRRFTMPGDTEAFLDAMSDAEKKGLVMSRYFADDADPNVRYAAFEPAVPASSVRAAA